MKLGSLHARLACALFFLLALVGAANLYSSLSTTELYLQEVNQSMNRDLASSIAMMKADQLLDEQGEIRRQGLDQFFHWMMVGNPEVQFYLVDLRGNILAYDPMAGDPLSDRVAIQPIRELLERPSSKPARAVLGDDPREPGQRKVFSASRVPTEGSAKGYLYVVLASQHFDSAAARLRDSYILRLSTRNALTYLGVVLVSGLLVFSFLTRPLRRLATRMGEIGHREADLTQDKADPASDEVQLLERAFEDMTLRIENQMEEIERMAAARRDLIANVSHDLRTPIASLRGYLDTLALKNGALSKEERNEYLAIAVRQSERLGTLVGELFELTKLDAHEVEPRFERFKIAELVQDNVQRFQLRALEKSVRLRADFDPDLAPVSADIGLMERVLENLLENALCFTPEGGAVTIELREELHRVGVRVVDTGCGIAAEDLPHIFDRYYRSPAHVASASQGAGLGLAITRRILELHRSELDIESAPGRGTTVSFSLEAAPRTHQLAFADLPATALG